MLLLVSFCEAFRWTAVGGMVPLGTLGSAA
jgi:hypothetical protein